MQKEIIRSERAPKAIGPYSQAVKVGTSIFCSGQIPINPTTGDMVTDSIEDATRQCLNNIKAVLESTGSSLSSVVKVTVYLKNINDFPQMNEIYATFFTNDPPARACVEVARLPKDSLIEIDAIAIVV